MRQTSQGACAGIHVAHAGRKTSTAAPWTGGAMLKTAEEGGWPVLGPSAIPFHPDDPVPIALDEAGIDAIVGAFDAAARRALAAGFR
jgi:2,4-dienoyl-CoA reductase-like NADH-dependent reductase (Old Yellow Enzyme family)